VAQPRFAQYQRPDRPGAGSWVALERRLKRLGAQCAGLEQVIAERKHEAGSLARRVTWLKREARDLLLSNAGLKSRAERQAAEDAQAAVLARRVVKVLEDGQEPDPFTAALAALAQRKRRVAEIADGDDPRLAALAWAVQEAAVRRAQVRQLQIRQITVNKQHGPESPEADKVRREIAAGRLAMAVLACMGTGLDADDVISVALTGQLPDSGSRMPRLLTNPGWPAEG
jgi:hypothetical protein